METVEAINARAEPHVRFRAYFQLVAAMRSWDWFQSDGWKRTRDLIQRSASRQRSIWCGRSSAKMIGYPVLRRRARS